MTQLSYARLKRSAVEDREPDDHEPGPREQRHEDDEADDSDDAELVVFGGVVVLLLHSRIVEAGGALVFIRTG